MSSKLYACCFVALSEEDRAGLVNALKASSFSPYKHGFGIVSLVLARALLIVKNKFGFVSGQEGHETMAKVCFGGSL